jgi:hypothetical protein
MVIIPDSSRNDRRTAVSSFRSAARARYFAGFRFYTRFAEQGNRPGERMRAAA